MPGTHGSLTKAGKVRNVTPKVEKHGVNSRPKKIPRIRFRKNYLKRVMQSRYGGQPNSISAQKFNRAKEPA
jgi:small subunit ribosomal protein S30e